MPQNASMWSRSSGQPKNDEKTLFFSFLFTLHPLSPVIFATATVVAFVLFRNSRFSFHCYIQREATPPRRSARKWRCDLSRLLARKITKGTHSCKPASLYRPIAAGSGDDSVVERRTRDLKISRSSPGRSGGRISFSRVNFLCWLYVHRTHAETIAVPRGTSHVTAKQRCNRFDGYSVQLNSKNFNHPTTGNFVVVMAGSQNNIT